MKKQNSIKNNQFSASCTRPNELNGLDRKRNLIFQFAKLKRMKGNNRLFELCCIVQQFATNTKSHGFRELDQ